jgi:signal transduction histidine kinase
MIPRIMRTFLYILFCFLFFSSCQKKNSNTTKQKSTKPQVEKLIIVADKFYDDRKFDSAFYYYNKVKFICNPVTDAENYVSTLDRMADIQQTHGDYAGSESTVTKAIPYLKYVKNPKHAWNSYVILGINYLNTYDFKSALLYFNKALTLKTTEWRKAAAKNNIALVFIEQQKYNEAIAIFEYLLETEGVKKFQEDYARALDNLGYCYYKIGDARAASYLEKAFKIRTDIQDNTGLGRSYMHLAFLHKKDNPSLSKKYMLLSYQKYSLVNSVDSRLESLKHLVENSSDKELKKHSLAYVNLVDSIFEVRQKAKNQFAKIKYDSKKDRDENLKLKTHKFENELQLERQKNRNIISYIIIAFSLSLIIVLYFYLTSRGNKEKIEATYNSETRIAKKLHDELANDIYHTMAFAENKNLALAENREQLLSNLDAIYSRTRDISQENGTIITDKNYVLVLKEMIAGFNTPNLNLIINGLDTIEWCVIEKNTKITIYRVLQELLVNMKKHSNASLVGINFKSTNKNVSINYTDNGQGINISNITFKNGLHNVENRILNIKGRINIDSAPDKGFKVFIKFPL